MADLTGRLNIELQRCDGRVAATIRSSRPIAASRIFVGKAVAETATTLPALFSICTTAQACACASACESALGMVRSPAVGRLRRLLVDAETVKEHLWRMLLDWPRFLDRPPMEKGMSRVMRTWLRLRVLLVAGADPLRPGADAAEPDLAAAALVLDELAQLTAEQVLGAHPGDWLAGTQTREDLLAWTERTDTAAARLVGQVEEQGWAAAGRSQVVALPRLNATDLNPLLSGPDVDHFVAEPMWQGEPRESSPFTRQRKREPVAALTRDFGNGLLPRLAAQLVELASLQQGLRTELGHLDELIEPLAGYPEDAFGIAQVQAARGLLVHRVAVDKDRICDYRILAPTEWNFHPRGVVVQGLSDLSSMDAGILQRLASLFVTAVDPCVDYHLTVT